MAITSIAFAFAQPFLPVSHQNTKSNTVATSIFLDNSFSTENNTSQGRVFDVAKEFGFQLVEQLPTHINHQLLSNNFSGAEQHLYPNTEITKNLEQLKSNHKTKRFSDIIKRQQTAFDQKPFNSYVISDFQKSQFNFDQIDNDTLTSYTLIPIEPVLAQNISIDSVWFNDPVHRINKPEEIHFRLKNYNDKNITGVRTTLFIDSVQKSFGNFDIPAHSYLDTFLVFNSKATGWHKGLLQINDHPIVFDNSFYFSFNVLEKIKVLSITSSLSLNNVQKAFDIEPYFEFSEVNQSKIDFNQLRSNDLLVLNEVTNFSSGMNASIKQFVKNGGHLIVIPSGESNNEKLNDLLVSLQVSSLKKIDTDSTRVNYINLNQKIYKNVFTNSKEKINLPDIYKHYRLSPNPNQTVLLQTVNKHSILSSWESGKGQVFIFTVPLNPEYSNFRIHSIFLPTLFQIAFNSSPQFALYQTIHQDDFVVIKQPETHNDILYHITNKKQNLDIIPEKYPVDNGVKLIFHNSIEKAGNYVLQAADSSFGLLSFNYSRTESNPQYYSTSDLETIIDSLNLSNYSVFTSSMENFSDELKKRETGIELWRWFILAALLFLAIEIILIRYFKPSVL